MKFKKQGSLLLYSRRKSRVKLSASATYPFLVSTAGKVIHALEFLKPASKAIHDDLVVAIANLSKRSLIDRYLHTMALS